MRPAWWEWGVQEPIPIDNVYILPSALENRNHISPGELRFPDCRFCCSPQIPASAHPVGLQGTQSSKQPQEPRNPRKHHGPGW